MLRLGRFLGALMLIVGIINTAISLLGLVYVIVKHSYELRFLHFTLNNPDAQLLVIAIISFLIGLFGFSIYNRYDILLNYKKYEKR